MFLYLLGRPNERTKLVQNKVYKMNQASCCHLHKITKKKKPEVWICKRLHGRKHIHNFHDGKPEKRVADRNLSCFVEEKR